MRPRACHIGVFGSLLLAVTSPVWFPFDRDPVFTDNASSIGDNRRHHLDNLTYSETEAIMTDLHSLAGSSDKDIRRQAVGRLVTIYRKRTMISDSLRWLKIGLREFPTDPHLRREEAEMKRIIARNQAEWL